jgi:hypothetical protein
MGDRLTERDAHGRRRVNLFRLPRWAQISIALVIVGVVVIAARTVEPHPAQPGWLTPAIRVGGWVYLGLVVVALVSWLVRRRRR